MQTIAVQTRGRGLHDVTAEIRRAVEETEVDEGLCVVFCFHTSAGLVIQENADPRVLDDLDAWLSRAVPDGDPIYTHTAEGPDDMPAHVRTMLTRTSETFLVSGGRLQLGTWQAIYLFEHRAAPHVRRLGISVA